MRRNTQLAALALLLLTGLLIIPACSTSPSSGVAINSSTGRGALTEDFKNGSARLECGTSCAGAWGGKRRQMRALYDAEVWADLAINVLSLGFRSDQTYYYLGRAAEGLGHDAAAETYYRLSIAATKGTGHRCDGIINNCDGLVFPGDAESRLAVVLQKKEEAIRQAKAIVQKSESASSPPIPVQPQEGMPEKKYTTGDLAVAAETGNIERVKRLLEEGENVNEKDNNGRTPLLAATARDHYAVVKLLLDKGADVNARHATPPRITALSVAVVKNHTRIVELLLDRGADINERVSGMTPLMSAALTGRRETVTILLKRGADVYAKTAMGWTAIDYANSINDGEIAGMLKSAGGTNAEFTRPVVRQPTGYGKSTGEEAKKDIVADAKAKSETDEHHTGGSQQATASIASLPNKERLPQTRTQQFQIDKPSEVVTQEPPRQPDISKPVIKPPTAPSGPKSTTSQRLAAAKTALETGYKPDKDPRKTTWGNLSQAEYQLKMIESFGNDAEKSESEKVWKEIERRRTELNRIEQASPPPKPTPASASISKVSRTSSAAKMVRATIIKKAFGCYDENLTWELGTAEFIGSVAKLIASQDQGKCIELRAGDVVYVGRPSERYRGLVQIQPLGSQKKYWTAEGLLSVVD